ncbi:MAG: radical SAM protein [Candidatus Omnitrophota bacterium]|nr:radical SAM protein [Candidatus Omnitrophota bacterium]
MCSRNDKIQRVAAIRSGLRERLSSCDICPRSCRVNRGKGERGACGLAGEMRVYTAFLHHGEEPAISGIGGSGTIFFSGCNLQCVYCQNYRFSHQGAGRILSTRELAHVMLSLEKKGAHNINLVTPTHLLPQIVEALDMALAQGLASPIVYNTSGYESPAIIRLLEGIVDIYLPDMKYIRPETAKSYSAAPDYPRINQEAIIAMSAQAQTALWDGDLLRSGIIVRHLVLPGHVDESLAVIAWLKEHLPRALVSVMFQYQPYHKASVYPRLTERIRRHEYQAIRDQVEELGLRGWVQEYESREDLAGVHFTPEALDELL